MGSEMCIRDRISTYFDLRAEKFNNSALAMKKDDCSKLAMSKDQVLVWIYVIWAIFFMSIIIGVLDFFNLLLECCYPTPTINDKSKDFRPRTSLDESNNDDEPKSNPDIELNTRPNIGNIEENGGSAEAMAMLETSSEEPKANQIKLDSVIVEESN